MNQSVQLSDELAEFIIKNETAGTYAPRIFEFEKRAATKELSKLSEQYPAGTLFTHRLIKKSLMVLDMAAITKDEKLFEESLFKLSQDGILTEDILLPHLEKAILGNNIDRINTLLCVNILQNRDLSKTITWKHKILALCLVKRSATSDTRDAFLMDRALKDRDFVSFCMFEEVSPNRKRTYEQSKQIREIFFKLNQNEKETMIGAKEKAIAELNDARKNAFNFRIIASEKESKSIPTRISKPVQITNKIDVSSQNSSPAKQPLRHIDICA